MGGKGSGNRSGQKRAPGAGRPGTWVRIAPDSEFRRSLNELAETWQARSVQAGEAVPYTPQTVAEELIMQTFQDFLASIGPKEIELWRAGSLTALDGAIADGHLAPVELEAFNRRVRTARFARNEQGDQDLLALLREYCPDNSHITSYPGHAR